jgi:hypothetical protein
MDDVLTHKYREMRESALSLGDKFGAEKTVAGLRRGDSIENIFTAALDELSVEQLKVVEEHAAAEEWEHGAHLKIPELSVAQRAKLLAVITELQHCEWATRALKDLRSLTPREREALVKTILDARDPVFASCVLWDRTLDVTHRAALVTVIMERDDPFWALEALKSNANFTNTERDQLQRLGEQFWP